MASAAPSDEPTPFPKTPGLRAGQVLAGRYSIHRVIGSGGMATIVEATHLELGSRVAVKVLHPGHATGEAIDRFLREARAIFPLRSENVCRVLDLGRLPDGSPFIVMEYLEGEDFASAFRSTQLPPSRAAGYVAQACKGLSEAHALGIVHRDVKPANLFLTKRPDGRDLVKVLDFGISKLRVEGDESLTAEGQVLGTPRYMAPEQFGGATAADARSDVWALGLVLYKLIAGRLPYTATNIADIYAELMNRAPADIRSAVPTIDPALGAIVMRCLERDAKKRFSSARELGAALEPFTRETSDEVLVAAPVDVPAKRSFRPLALLAALVVVVVAVGAAAYFGTRHGAAKAPPVSTDGRVGSASATNEASSATAPAAPPPSSASIAASASASEPVRTTHKAKPPSRPPPNCSPPYYYDSKGDKIFRRECVH